MRAAIATARLAAHGIQAREPDALADIARRTVPSPPGEPPMATRFCRLSNAELAVMLRRSERNVASEESRALLVDLRAEAAARAMLNPRTNGLVAKWTPAEVEDLMAPFIEATRTVAGNERLPNNGFTHAGGFKVTGLAYLDSYTGVKKNGVNATLVAFITKAGEAPNLCLYVNPSPNTNAKSRTVAEHIAKATRTFTLETLLPDGLPLWRALAAKARGE